MDLISGIIIGILASAQGFFLIDIYSSRKNQEARISKLEEVTAKKDPVADYRNREGRLSSKIGRGKVDV